MEKQDQATQEKGSVICPNCGGTDMEEVCNPFTTMDRLEWLSFINTTLVSGFLLINFGRFLLECFGVTEMPLKTLGYALFMILIVAAATFSYCTIANLSVERYCHDGICVWYVRCAKCHSKYRVVRPLGTIPPWGTEDDAVEAEYEEIPEEATNAADS